MRTCLLTALALLVPPVPTLAAQDSCDSARTQADLNECASRAATRSSERIAALLKELGATLDSSRQRGLNESQVRWNEYIHTHCQWEADAFAGGSVAPMWFANCLAAGTEARIAELKVHLCEGEGMTGYCKESHKYDLPKPRRRSKG